MRRHHLLICVAAAALCTRPIALGAQTNLAPVRAVADSFLAAMANERWGVAASFLDLDAVTKLLREAQGNVRAQLPTPPLTVETLMAQDSTMPRAVAEWQVARLSAFPHDPFSYVTRDWAGVTTPREFLALTPSDAAARWVHARDFRFQMLESWKMQGCKGDLLPMMPPAKQTPVIAVALANDSMAYALYYGSSASPPAGDVPYFSSPSVMTLVRKAGIWRIEPADDLIRGSGAIGISC
jgi:hypothetical protein